MSKTIGVSLFALMIASSAEAQQIGDVFYIDMENHNLTQPSSTTSPAPLLANPAAPYLNSLITPGSPNAAQTSWASNYTNAAPGVHPSLPNYLWQEQGTNNGVFNDNQPFGTGGANQGDAPSLSGLLQAKYGTAGWKSFQEDIDLNLTTGAVLPQSQWTVPLTNQSGTIAGYTNPYNGSNQYNFATKHDGQLYFNATNGGDDTTTSNPEAKYYAPLQQLSTDLATNTGLARYNLITPDQFNDMHSALTGGFNYLGTHYTGDQASIAQGDNFLSIIVPEIEASQAYQDSGAIVIWFDETEGGDTSAYTLAEIVISPLAKGNAYDSTLPYNHSSDLRSLEELFGVYGPGDTFLGGAANASDLSDLFRPGAIAVPEASTWAMMLVGFAGLAGAAAGRRSAGGKPAALG
jgi:phosphatidylinositol-3-phosphatase